MAQDNVEQQVLDGSLWDEFCDSLKEAGKVVQSAGAPDNVFDRAEGYRYLTRLLRGGGWRVHWNFPILPFLYCAAPVTKLSRWEQTTRIIIIRPLPLIPVMTTELSVREAPSTTLVSAL